MYVCLLWNDAQTLQLGKERKGGDPGRTVASRLLVAIIPRKSNFIGTSSCLPLPMRARPEGYASHSTFNPRGPSEQATQAPLCLCRIIGS